VLPATTPERLPVTEPDVVTPVGGVVVRGGAPVPLVEAPGNAGRARVVAEEEAEAVPAPEERRVPKPAAGRTVVGAPEEPDAVAVEEEVVTGVMAEVGAARRWEGTEGPPGISTPRCSRDGKRGRINTGELIGRVTSENRGWTTPE